MNSIRRKKKERALYASYAEAHSPPMTDSTSDRLEWTYRSTQILSQPTPWAQGQDSVNLPTITLRRIPSNDMKSYFKCGRLT